MSLTRLMSDPITILRGRLVTDRNHNDVIDWLTPDEIQTVGWLNDTSSSEVIDGRDALVTEWHLYLPADADVTGRDRIRDAAGVVYLVDGPISSASRPSKGMHHLECRLKLVEG